MIFLRYGFFFTKSQSERVDACWNIQDRQCQLVNSWTVHQFQFGSNTYNIKIYQIVVLGVSSSILRHMHPISFFGVCVIIIGFLCTNGTDVKWWDFPEPRWQPTFWVSINGGSPILVASIAEWSFHGESQSQVFFFNGVPSFTETTKVFWMRVGHGEIEIRRADHRKGWFEPLFPPSAAAAPAPAAPSVQMAAPGWENTMAAKDGKASKLRAKSA